MRLGDHCLLYTSHHLGFRGSQQQLVVIGRQTVGKHIPAQPSAFFVDPTRTAIEAAIILDEHSASIAPRDSDRCHHEIQHDAVLARRFTGSTTCEHHSQGSFFSGRLDGAIQLTVDLARIASKIRRFQRECDGERSYDNQERSSDSFLNRYNFVST